VEIDINEETKEKTEEETDQEIIALMTEEKNSLLSLAILATKLLKELFENSLRIVALWLISVSLNSRMERAKDFAMLILNQEMH